MLREGLPSPRKRLEVMSGQSALGEPAAAPLLWLSSRPPVFDICATAAGLAGTGITAAAASEACMSRAA